jgi:hypothetical protein
MQEFDGFPSPACDTQHLHPDPKAHDCPRCKRGDVWREIREVSVAREQQEAIEVRRREREARELIRRRAVELKPGNGEAKDGGK